MPWMDKLLSFGKGIAFSEIWDASLQEGETPDFKEVDEARIDELK